MSTKVYRAYSDVIFTGRITIFPYGTGIKMFDISVNNKDAWKIWKEFAQGIKWYDRWGYIPTDGKEEILQELLKFGIGIIYEE